MDLLDTVPTRVSEEENSHLALLRNIRVVMVRPKGSLNVGLVARMIKNMGIGGLVLVDPPELNMEQAVRMASRATDVLQGTRIVRSLGEALADTVFSAGTSARSGGDRGTPLLPRRVAACVLDGAAKGQVAIVLGPEDHGLSNEDLALCTVRGAIPSSPDYSSLNITHAAALFCYECRMVALQRDGDGVGLGGDVAGGLSGAGGLQGEENGEQVVASHGETEGLMEHLGGLLARVGFLNPQNPQAILRKVRKLLSRSRASGAEVAILRGMLRQIEWYIDREK